LDPESSNPHPVDPEVLENRSDHAVLEDQENRYLLVGRSHLEAPVDLEDLAVREPSNRIQVDLDVRDRPLDLECPVDLEQQSLLPADPELQYHL
jgi:hypothetical protein